MKKINHVVVLCVLFMFNSLPNIQAQVSKGGIPPSIQFKSVITSGLDEINVPAINVSTVMAEDSARPGPLWVGRSVPVGVNMTNAGTWTDMPDGSRVWRLKIKAAGAKAIGVYYDDFYIPEGGKLFLYNESQTQVIGAYTNENNPPSHLFATELVQGESVTLEYVEAVKRATKFETLDYLNGHFRDSKSYGSGSLPANQTPIISISEISYVYKDIPFLFRYDPAKSTGWNASNACQVNVNCAPEGTNWQNQKNGVAEIYLKIGPSYGFCSGTLVNTTNNSQTPYFLTADHCHSEGGTTASALDMTQWEFYFKYEGSGCADPATEPAYSTIIGCTLKAASPIDGGSDFCLVLFNSTPPQSYLPYYNGWDRTNTAATSGVGIHHPQGDIKKISTFSSTVTTATWDDGTNLGMADAHWEGEYIETTNGFSQTEGGSSGSPLFNSAGRQVGTLTGGTAANCTNGSIFDYGKFFYHWDKTGTGPTTQLKTWLDPTSTNATTANGYDPFATALPSTDFVAVSPSTLLYPIPILRTQTVTYEDRTWGAPSTWNWAFEGGTPATSTAQNPSAVTYNTNGLFDVSLTTHNTNGDSTLTAGNYIHVMDPATVTCDTMNQFWGTPTIYTATGGYVGGTNNYGCQAIAEKFVSYTPFNKLTGGRFWWSQATNGSSPNVTFVVWADDGSGKPGAQLATTTVPLATVVSNFNGVGYTDVVFPSEVILPTNSFFLGFLIPGNMSLGDTLAIITNNDDDNDNQTGYSLYSSWETYASWGLSLSNTIFPFACHDPFLPPVADFTGTPTTLPATQSVTFTNHCYGGAVATYSWSFPGANTTSSSLPNPVIQYNNPGYYSVTLTVSNAYGSNAITRTNYIHVMSSGSCSCNTLDNVVGDEALYTMGADGYVSGTNSYFTQVAEIFDDYGTYTSLNGAYFSWGYVCLVTGTTPVTFTAYRNNGTGGAPNTVMGTTTVPMSTIYNDYLNNQMTYVKFATPLTITTPFYIAMTMPTTTGDTIAVNTGGENAGTDDGWAKYGTTWYAYSGLFGSTFNHAIYPIVCNTGAPLPAFTVDRDTVYQTGSVVFTDQSTCSPTSWSWTFEGGTPATSTTQNPTVVYNTVGNYDVTLISTNASGNNTELKTDYITVLPIIVKWVFPNALTADDANSDGGITANYNPPTYKTITVQGGVSAPTFGTVGATSKCASATGWATGSGSKYWQIEFVTTGYQDLKVSSKMTGNNDRSPRDFKLQYRIGTGGTWTDVAGATNIVLANTSWTTSTANLSYVPLPSACNNQASVYLRWIMTSNTGIGGLGVQAANACYIDDIIVCGSPANVSPPVAAFSGTPTTLCQGSTVTYTDLSTNNPTSWAWTFPGGTPATSTAQNPTVTYNTAGTYNVTLIATNANGSNTITSTNYVTVSAPVAQTITGTTPICIGSTQTWTSTTGGGTWTSGTPAVATVGSGTGVVTGVTAGSSVITYSVTTGGCVNTATKTVTISGPTAQTITGTTPICIGSNQTWTSTTGGGTWTSGTPAVATVGSGTGVVTGVTAGSSVITYSVTTGGCVNTATKTVTISGPTAQTITGTTPICIGSTQTWTSTTGGGTWTSGTPAVATVGSGTGVVTGVTAGSSVITYSVTTGGCVNTATKTVTISAPTVQTIIGTTPICIGSTQTWTSTTGGGTWTSGTPAVATVGSGTGVVTGVTAGSSLLTYSVTTGGCVNTATKTVTISAPTAQTITGTTPICIGSTQTWTSTTGGGTWTSGTPAVATVGSGTGVVTGVTAGSSVITYSVTTGGCVNTATKTVTISAPTAQTITGTTPICIGSTQTWTSTTGGGTWTSGTPAVATVGSSTGVVTGVTAGSSVISYSVTTGGCVNTATKTVTISGPTAQTITGTTPICVGSNQTWTSTTGGGTWSSGTPAVATVGSSTGVVTGVTAGASVITYSVTTGGCVNTATKTVTISAPTAQTITGTTPICIGSNQTWTSTTGGGTWTSGTPAIATVGSSTGVVTGVTAGFSVITYTVTTGVCINTATKTVTVNGNSIVPTFTALGPYCLGATPGILSTTSNNGITGSWSPDIISTISTGTTTYTFTPATGQCAVLTTMNIEVDENIIPVFTALGPYCVGATPGTLPTTSNNGITGTWNPATISTTSAGTTTYTFTPTIGQCATNTVDMAVTVNPNVLPTFTALGPYCAGATADALLTTSTNGITGTWSPAVITTSAAGTATYTYTPTTGQCATTATMNVTVNQMPFADAGVDAAYTVTPVLIGNAANGPGTISWSPSAGLDNAGIAQPSASPAVTTIYTLTVNYNGCIATDAVTITLGDFGHTISGKTRYAARANVGIPAPNPPTYNAVVYSIDNVIVILKNYPSGTEVARDTSDALGQYQLNGIMNGNYILSTVKYAADTMQWCNDVNAADVGLLMYLITSDTILDPSRCFSAKYMKAADVDNNSHVNTIDVARIKAKIGSPYLATKNFPKGNWDVLNTAVSMAGSDMNVNLEIICNGDYNASSSKYRDSLTTWSGAKSQQSNIIVVSDEYISLTDPDYFEIPLRISKKMNEFSALGLELTYPDGYKLTNAFIPKAIIKSDAVKINQTLDEIITGNNDLLVTDEEGVIRVVYATTNHFDVAANDEMIVLGFRKLSDKQQKEPEFILSGTGIIANQYGAEDDDAYLLMPKLLVQGDNSGEGFEFTGYPNPFNGEATITYTLPENGTVKIKAYNATGELVAEIVNEEQIAGKHMVDFSPKNLPAGMYTFKLDFVGLSRSECLILKMVH